MNPYASILILASTHGGKSTLLKNIIEFYKKWQIVVLSDVAGYNGEYEYLERWSERNKVLPINEESWETIRRLIERQKQVALRAKNSPEYVARHRVLLVLDDAISEHMDYGLLGELLSRARHLYIKIIISTQAAQASLRPLGRYNIGILFLGNISSESVKYSYPMSGASGTHGIRNKTDFVNYHERTIKPFSFIRFCSADPTEPPRLVGSRDVTVRDTVVGAGPAR